MLELHHVRGETWVIETAMAYLPFYKLNDRDIVLLDTGFASADRENLTETLAGHGFQVKGILLSHAHMDHAGSVAHLQSIYGCRVGAHLIEAAIAATPYGFRRHYGIYNSGYKDGLEECFTATDLIMPGQTELAFCGATFGIVHLPGHSGGHIGIVTPDNVAYLGDVLMGFPQLEGSKMPTTQFLGQDLASKRRLFDLQADRYIVAHKVIAEDIRPLAQANLACIEAKLQQMLEVLQGAPTRGEWLIAWCEQQRWQVRSERSFAILEYGFHSAVQYLEETGRVVSRRVNGNKRYKKV